MNTAIKKRQLKLERESQVSSIEAQCLAMKVDQEKDFKILDTLVHQRLRTRLHVLKNTMGIVFETQLREDKLNTVTVTRKA